jgi:hypothetical protein
LKRKGCIKISIKITIAIALLSKYENATLVV